MPDSSCSQDDYELNQDEELDEQEQKNLDRKLLKALNFLIKKTSAAASFGLNKFYMFHERKF